MQPNVDGWLAATTTARVDQHWPTLLHVPNYHQCIVSLSMTKWSNKYTFIYLIYIKTAGILFRSIALPRCFGYPVGKVNFGLKLIQSIQPVKAWENPFYETHDHNHDDNHQHSLLST
jgi:hypothetical protein